MPQVDYNVDNAQKCLCPMCPVQLQSQCVLQRRPNQGGAELADPKESIRVYCAVGKSSCTDLDSSKSCICGSCPVWQENKLGAHYYCLKGSSEELEK